MLKARIDKVDRMQEQMGNVWKWKLGGKKTKDEKHYNSEECL